MVVTVEVVGDDDFWHMAAIGSGDDGCCGGGDWIGEGMRDESLCVFNAGDIKRQRYVWRIWAGVGAGLKAEAEAGANSFARCLIEVNLEADLVDVVTIGVPSLLWED
ncbi:hypothetical protein Tco_0683898 [Tanacetum coccineum]